MGYLLGLQEYMDESYNLSIFDQVFSSKQLYEFHVHTHRTIRAKIIENLTYDLKINIKAAGNELLPKTHVKFLYPEELAETVRPLLRTDKKTGDLGLEPMPSPQKRHHIKNKTLFPLMKEGRVLLFTLLEGEIIKGIITGFNRYEITVGLKGGLPITVLRHAVFDLRDKKGRCFLKSFQEGRRDWERCPLFVASPPG